ncbi:MAG TPA: hydroxyacylglutathione hydrolase [Gammaproteobacteria bacterium]|nr:hydroxyacylglutathione hydrolase [Gammaproteobacteria bacterium]
MLRVHTVNAFDDNYIWLIQHPERPQVVIVDPGDAAPVIEALQRQALAPAAIFITHHHWDHVGGIGELLAHWSIPVYGPARETIPHLSHPLSDNERVHIDALDSTFQVMDVPGHTAGHIAYVGPGKVFVGDTLFAGGCGRLFEGTPEQMHASLSRIAALPDDTLVYCAHEYTADNLVFARIAEPGNPAIEARQQAVQAQRAQGLPTVPSRLGEEKATNPFLRCDQPEIIRNAEAFAGRKLSSGAEVFAVVRHWKDTLD